MKAEIFVQIPSYRDPQTLPTILDALDKARYPERISIGLCWQYMPGADEPMLPRKALPDNVRLLSAPAITSNGACWARHKVQTLYNNEDYTLSIDSHTRFIENWDEIIIEEFKRCENANAILSTYPAAYTLEKGTDYKAAATFLGAGYMLEGLPRFSSRYREDQSDRPLKGLFLAAGFHFAAGKMIEDIPADPYLYFNQEEILLSARAWTHGYDIYSPSQNLVFHLFHDNTLKSDKDLRRLHLEDNSKWVDWHKRANDRAFHILGITQCSNPDTISDISRYGLGNTRPLDEFFQLSGLDFSNDEISPRANNADFIEELNPWLKQHI